MGLKYSGVIRADFWWLIIFLVDRCVSGKYERRQLTAHGEILTITGWARASFSSISSMGGIWY